MSKTDYDAKLNSSVFKIFHFDQSVTIFLISNAERIVYTGGPCPPGEDRFICKWYDSNDEDFRVDNLSLQKTTPSESSGNNSVERDANTISPVPKSGRSCGQGLTQGRREKHIKSL